MFSIVYTCDWMNYFPGGRLLAHFFIIPVMLMSYSFMKIIPIREIVAGEANSRLSVSKMKFTFEPNDILSPVGSVRR